MPPFKIPDLKAVRILLAENDLTVADRVKAVLNEAGYDVQNAYNFGDAMSVDHSRFNLVIADALIADREGHGLLESIREHPIFRRIPLLALSRKPLDQKLNVKAITPTCSDDELLEVVGSILTDTQERVTHSNAIDPHLQQQLGELRTLSQLGRSIAATLDLNVVLNQIVEAATSLTGAEEGMLLLPDDANKALYIRAMKNVDEEGAQNFRIRTEDPLVGGVYTSGKPILVSDPGTLRMKTEYFVKSLLYVPLKSKGRVIGVLGVNNRREERIFTQHDQELLVDLAAYAAIAIENARLYERSQEQNRQLTTLVEAGRAVNSSLALNEVLRTIGEQLIQALNVHAGLVRLVDGETSALLPLAHVWRAVWRPGHGPQIDLDQRILLKQALSQLAYYTVTAGQNPSRWATELARLDAEGAAAMIMLPIRSGNSPIGIVELFYQSDPPEITDEFRSQIRGSALEICALSVNATSNVPQAPMLDLAERILDSTRANWLVISLFNGTALYNILRAGNAEFFGALKPSGPVFPADNAMFARRVPISFQRTATDLTDEVKGAMNTFGAAGMLCLPVQLKGKSYVTVMYDTLSSRRFTPEEVGLALALMSGAASAIENAQLYQDLERSLHELKLAQSNLVQATRLSTMGQLAAVVAHQINNPLTTIIVDSEIILTDMPDSNPIHEGITAIHRAGKRAHAVVKRLLSTARRSTIDETAYWINLTETIHNTLDLVTTHIERAGIKLEVQFEDKPAYALALPGYLEDVWLNLLLNAHDALLDTPEPVIKLTSERVNHVVTVSVCDNGPGIPEDHLPHLFDAFFTTKPSGEGTGLGLYICKKIVDDCGGEIQVQTTLNVGTCFHVKIPVRPT
jgi:signal transduction histidine kinase/CheY-like chemotaxis protein